MDNKLKNKKKFMQLELENQLIGILILKILFFKIVFIWVPVMCDF